MALRTELIIFDLDGVLCDMTEGHRICLNKSLEHLYGYSIPEELHYNTLNGLPTKTKIKYLIAHNLLPLDSDIEKINLTKQEYTVDYILTNIRIDTEKVKIFEYLIDQKIQFSVYTNSIRKTSELMLETIGFWPVHLISNEDVKNPKPNPEGYIQTMQYYNVKPINALIIEDSPHGIEAGLSSGAWIWRVKDVYSVTLENIQKVLV